MRKAFRWTTLAMIVAALGLCAWAQKPTQSLADVARENRKQKPQTEQKVWTNDNISGVSKGLATEGASTPDAAKTADESSDKTAADKAGAAEAKKDCDKTKDANCEKADADAKPSEADSAKKAEDYKKKLADLEKSAADLEREASLNEREWKLAQSAYYGDAGAQLRNQKKFYDDQVAHQKDAERLQKAVDDAKKQIEDLKEQARKDGIKF